MSPSNDGPRFTLAVDQNQYLPAGGDQAHAVLTVTATGPVDGVRAGAVAAEVIIVDCSTSMSGHKLDEAKRAARRRWPRCAMAATSRSWRGTTR